MMLHQKVSEIHGRCVFGDPSAERQASVLAH